MAEQDTPHAGETPDAQDTPMAAFVARQVAAMRAVIDAGGKYSLGSPLYRAMLELIERASIDAWQAGVASTAEEVRAAKNRASTAEGTGAARAYLQAVIDRWGWSVRFIDRYADTLANRYWRPTAQERAILLAAMTALCKGYDKGYKQGHNAGHEDGLREGKHQAEQRYEEGYEEGKREGITIGRGDYPNAPPGIHDTPA